MPAAEIDLARSDDIDGILELQARNQLSAGGMLSASLSRPWIERLIAEMPVIVARREGKVIGFLIASSREASSDAPIIRAMLAAYPGAPDAYIYGPVCVAAEARGEGLAAAMAEELRRRLPGREGILFIRRDNRSSLRAHAKMAMREVAEFTHNGVAHLVLAYRG